MSSFSFDLKKIKAFLLNVDGVISPSQITIQSDGGFLRKLNLKDLSAIKKAISEDFIVGFISEYSDPNLKNYLNAFALDSQFICLGRYDKDKCLEEFLMKYGLSEENLLFIGSDLCDREVMNLSCLSVAPADASIDILQIAKYISPYNGGDGVVRDVIEQVLKSQSKWLTYK